MAENDTGLSPLPMDETNDLISSSKVEGTSVFNLQGERLGTVYNFMVDKRTGQVEYAVLSFGGFLGLGESYHPLPWRALRYDLDRDGYVVDLDRAKLEAAPHYPAEQEPRFDTAYRRDIAGYYGYPYGP